nr:MAG: hypothetical protein [Polycipiviridae sp.]
MNGRGNGFSINARTVSNNSARNVPRDVLFPSGSNMSPLSNKNYFANITQASGTFNSPPSSQSSGTGLQGYLQRTAPSTPTFTDNSGNRRNMPSGYHQVPIAEKTAQGITSTDTTSAIVGGVGAARTAALSAGGMGPIAIAAQVSQQVGQGIGSSLKANDESKMMKDYAANSKVASVGNTQNAALIRNAQQDTINKNYNAAMIGSLFGPLGALAGHFVSSLVNTQDRPVFEANSFQGGVDPTDSGINGAQSTAAPSGRSEMQDSINGN